MQDAAYCKTQALLFRDRAARATTPEEWLTCLDLARRWDLEARRLEGGDAPEAGTDAPEISGDEAPDAGDTPEAA